MLQATRKQPCASHLDGTAVLVLPPAHRDGRPRQLGVPAR